MKRKNQADDRASTFTSDKSAKARWAAAMAAGLGLAYLGGAPARATTIYWDGTGTGWDSTGSWSTVSDSSDSSNDPLAVPGSGDDVVFNISTVNSDQTVNLNASQAANSLTFVSSGATALQGGGTDQTLTIAAGGISISAGAGAVTIGSATTGQAVAVALSASQNWINDSGNTFTVINGITGSAAGAQSLTISGSGNSNLSGVIGNGSGTLSLVKSGNGALTLSNTNTFTGGLNITGGTVAVSAAGGTSNATATALFNNPLGGATGTGAITLNGGALQVALANGSFASTNNHVITVGDSGGTIKIVPSATNNVTPTFNIGAAGNLIGSGTLTVVGTGAFGTNAATSSNYSVLVMNNANAGFTGNMIIQDGGVVEITNAGAISSSSTYTLNNVGQISLGGITLSNAITVNDGGVLGFNGAGTYAGNITLNGAATARMQNWYRLNSQAGTISGPMSGGGSLTVDSGNSTGGTLTLTGTNGYTGATTIAAGSTLQLGNGGTTGVLSTSSAITDNGTFSINHSNAVTQGTDFSSAGITGSGGFAQSGNGTTTLNVANTFTGSMTLTAGIVSVADTSYLGGTTANNAIVFNGGTLQVTGTTMTGFGSHTLTYNASKTAGFDINNAANNFNAGSTAFVATNTLLKTGAGTLTLGAASNTIKILQLNQGTLDIGSNNLGISNAGGTTINDASTSGTVTINATGGGKIVLSQNSATDGPDIGAANGATLTINAVLTGTSSYENWTGTNNGTGVTILAAINDYSGDTLIHGGVLSVSKVGNQASTTSNLGQGTTIHFGTSNVSTGTLLYTGAGETSDRVIDLQGTTAGGIIDQSGTGNLKFTSNLTATGAGAKTLTLQGSTAGTGELAGAIVDNTTTNRTSVTKVGTGTWTLSGANLYSGGTRANAGTLALSGSHTHTGTNDFISVNNVGAQNAVLKITSGAGTLAYQDMPVAEVNNSRGAVYQLGGTFSTEGGNGFRLGSGAPSYGYYLLSGGTLSINGAKDTAIGYGNGSTGVMDITAGSLTASSWIVLGRNGGTASGLLNVTGGSVTSNSNNIALDWGGSSGAISILNVGGGAGSASVTGVSNAANYFDVSVANIAGQTGVANLLSNGTLTVAKVQAAGAASTALFNFNGGTLKATALNAGVNYMNSGNMDAVTVYKNGGTIDNSGTNITIGNVLATATGNGVTSIGVTNGGSGYIGAPLVTITGGTGNAATGYAVMADDGTGNGTYKVNSIVITSPGTYTVDPTTVNLTGGGASTAATIGGITTSANLSGGMSFSGSGTTTLTVANSYTGATTIQAGTLALSLASSTNNIAGSSRILVGDTAAHNTAVLNVAGLSGAGITLGTNQTLAGYGTITGAVTGSATGTVAPGNSVGQLTVNGNFNMGGGKLGIELSKTIAHAGGGQQVAGTDYDQLIVSGASSTVSINGSTLALAVGDNLVTGDVFYILDNQGSATAAANGQFYVATINGTTAQIGGVDTSASNQLTDGSTFSAAGYSFTISYGASVSGTSNDISLTAVSVPEPSLSVALLGLGGAGLLMRRRRLA